MYISYNKLWKILINKKGLSQISGVSNTTIVKLGKGENVNTDVLLKICEALECDIAEVVK